MLSFFHFSHAPAMVGQLLVIACGLEFLIAIIYWWVGQHRRWARFFLHPIMVMGWWLMGLEKIFYHASPSGHASMGVKNNKKDTIKNFLQLTAGFLYITLAMAPVVGLFFITLPPMVETVVVAFMLAGGSLFLHVADVARGLDKNLSAARAALQKIVSRDAKQLDRAGVARGALESLSENFSDGVVAPMFFYFLFGLPGMMLYKMANTADSMVGYANQRYFYFGKVAARIDDALNFLPARLTAMLYLLAGLWVAPKFFFKAIKITLRHAPRHASPNSGWPEAALAGLMAVTLGGRRVYPGGVIKTTTIGAGRAKLGAADIRRGMILTAIAFLLLLSLLVLYGVMA